MDAYSKSVYAKTIHTTVSPRSWGLECSTKKDSPYLSEMGLPKNELETRAHNNTYEWLMRQFDESVGAFHGFYDAPARQFAAPQTANLIAPFQLIAAFDRYGDEHLLDMARRSRDWMERNMVETHPMSLVLGGVRDNIKPDQLWTKYTADYVILNIALYNITADEELIARAIRSSKFLLQSQNHEFAPKYNDFIEQWVVKGWQSFGRVVVALLALEETIGDKSWFDRAMAWADFGANLQSPDGCFHLINNDYYSSDIAADELRSLVRVHLRTSRRQYLKCAEDFAAWHLKHQSKNGAWPLSVDRWDVPVGEYVGPGDIPNIAIAMLLLHMVTGNVQYLASAVRALRYSVTQQCVPGQPCAYTEDPNVHWGFWSWDPRYDFTMSSDQSTHHVRAYWFFLDYYLSLSDEVQKAVKELAGPPDPLLPHLPEHLLSSAEQPPPTSPRPSAPDHTLLPVRWLSARLAARDLSRRMAEAM